MMVTGPLDTTALLSELTLEEKASLCSGRDLWRTEAIERDGELVVPSLTVADGPHGLRKPAHGPANVGVGDSLPATCFPTASALGSSWDPELLERVGAALGIEARNEGVAVLLGPGINIKRSPLCGRNFEYLSEDPVLTGILGAALVKGVQGEGVGASLKHFAVNNQEHDRMRVSAEVDERTLREIYLAGFERVVKQADPWTVMCSYNRINGVYASEHEWLLTDVLRREWGYHGVVVSDWGAVNDRVGGLQAGLDLEMPSSGGVTDAQIVAAVRAGDLSMTVLDRSVSRLLGLINRSLRGPDRVVRFDGFDVRAHHQLAREVASGCAVLLKNERAILPLDAGAAGTLAVIGELARTPRYQGAGSSRVIPTRLDIPIEEISARAASDLHVTFAAGFGLDSTERDEALVEEAVGLARATDTVVLFLGLPGSEESEGFDRAHIDLPRNQIALLQAVAAVNDRVVVVLCNGSAVAVSPWEAHAHAIVEGWLLGQAGGGALADLLFGVTGPSGRLAETIPVRLEDTPSYLNFPGDNGAVRYGEGLFVGYRWYDARRMAVTYPFGHGLTYTSFAYEALTAAVSGTGAHVRVDLAVTVTNTGHRPGKEVVQVYVTDVESAVLRPERELKTFAKVAVDPGESRTVPLTLDSRDLSFFHPGVGRWVVEGGTFTIHVGASSRDLRLETSIDVEGEVIVTPLDESSTMREWLEHPIGAPLLRQTLAAAGMDGLLAPGADPLTVASLSQMPLSKLARFPGAPLTLDALRVLLDQVNGCP
jgi:beta-glucosidase